MAQDQRPVPSVTSKEEVLAALARSRREFDAEIEAAAVGLNPALMLRRSIHSHPTAWTVGSAMVGCYLASRFLFNGRRRKNKNGDQALQKARRPGLAILAGVLGKTAFTLAKPVATKMLQRRLEKLVE